MGGSVSNDRMVSGGDCVVVGGDSNGDVLSGWCCNICMLFATGVYDKVCVLGCRRVQCGNIGEDWWRGAYVVGAAIIRESCAI